MVFPKRGILAAFDIGRLGSRSGVGTSLTRAPPHAPRPRLVNHRGLGNGTYLCHEHLAIVGPDKGTPGALKDGKGEQPCTQVGPLLAGRQRRDLQHARARREAGLQCHSASDSEVVGLLFGAGPSCVSMLDGMFAFVVVDKDSGSIFAARDHMGIIPMYMARGHDSSVWFASR